MLNVRGFNKKRRGPHRVRRSLPQRAGTIKTARTRPGAAESSHGSTAPRPADDDGRVPGRPDPRARGRGTEEGLLARESQRRAWSRKEDGDHEARGRDEALGSISQELNKEVLVSDRASSRTRWLNHLPGIKREPWSEQEENVIYEAQQRLPWARNCCRAARTTPSRTTGTRPCGGTCGAWPI